MKTKYMLDRLCERGFLLIAAAGCILVNQHEMFAGYVFIYNNPSSPSNSFVFQVPGVVMTNFVAISNKYARPLNRTNLTNILEAYYEAQNPTNFDLYASLFEIRSRPTNSGTFGALPTTLSLMGVYKYGPYTFCDLRWRYEVRGSEFVGDILLPMIQDGNSEYYLTSDLEEPIVCLYEFERKHRSIANGFSLLATNWQSDGYFAMTNKAFGTNALNPWILWLPGELLSGIFVRSNTPVVTNFAKPYFTVISAIHALLDNQTNRYFTLVHPNELFDRLEYFMMNAASYISNTWLQSREAVANGVELCEQVIIGDSAYVTFRVLDTNGVPSGKDWLYLKRLNDEWRLSQRHTVEANAVIYYLFNTCTQFRTLYPKVLPCRNNAVQ